MSGPWVKLCEFLGGEVGKKMGRVVAGDLKRYEQIPGWGMAEKIEELATDRGLSVGYLKELISDSSTKGQYERILQYLENGRKSGNLSASERDILMQKVRSEIGRIEDSEILRGIIDAAKTKGATSLDSIADLISHIC
jgi:hypothetical protein